MTFLRIFAGLVAVTLLFFACRKERSDEDGKVPGVIENNWQFTEAGTLYSGNTDSASIQSIAGFTSLTIVGSKTGDTIGEIVLQVVGSSITTGTYTSEDVFFQYTENGSLLFQSSPGEGSGFSVIISEIDSSHVSGTFSGTVKDSQGNTHEITNGSFTAEITSGQQPEPLPEGVLTLWSKQLCLDGGPIEIKVGTGASGFITEALPAEPLCGAGGTATFTLPVGNYVVTAICGDDTLTYNANVETTCTFLEVNFAQPPVQGDYLPLTQGAYWDYNNLSDLSRRQRRTIDGEEVLDGRLYTRVLSDLPDTLYFRKNGNVYYEYRNLDFQEFVSNAPSLEVEILHDDYASGQSWESPPAQISFSGIPVLAKLVSTILQRDFSATINGTSYNDLIEVQTEIFFSSNNGASYQSSGSSYLTVFAKDKGIVYYFDLNESIEWGVNNIFLNP